MQNPTESSRSRPDWNTYFQDMASTVSTRANCRRRMVGAVIVKENRIIGTGYNGAPSGIPGCLEGACPRGLLGYDEVAGLGDYDRPNSPGFCTAVHAEVNALLNATRDTQGATAYITDPPCPNCRKVLAAAGIIKVVWPNGELHHDQIMDFTKFAKLS